MHKKSHVYIDKIWKTSRGGGQKLICQPAKVFILFLFLFKKIFMEIYR